MMILIVVFVLMILIIMENTMLLVLWLGFLLSPTMDLAVYHQLSFWKLGKPRAAAV